MIVVEGPDFAGKSTLVSHLANKFGLRIGERGVADRDKLYTVTRKDTYNALGRAVRGESPPIIWDRLFLSEFVYHDIEPGRPCEFNPYESQIIRDVMDAIKCPVIMCLPPWGVVRDGAATTHQMAGVVDNIRLIYSRYEQGLLPLPENVIYYDYTGTNPEFATLDAVEEEVAGYIVERKGRMAWPVPVRI